MNGTQIIDEVRAIAPPVLMLATLLGVGMSTGLASTTDVVQMTVIAAVFAGLYMVWLAALFIAGLLHAQLGTFQMRNGRVTAALKSYERATHMSYTSAFEGHQLRRGYPTLLASRELQRIRSGIVAVGESLVATTNIDLAYRAFQLSDAEDWLRHFRVEVGPCPVCNGKGYWPTTGGFSASGDHAIDLRNAWDYCSNCQGSGRCGADIRYDALLGSAGQESKPRFTSLCDSLPAPEK